MWTRGSVEQCKIIQHVLLAFSINCARQSSLAWRIVKNSLKKMRNKIAYLLNVKTQLIGIVSCGNDTFVATNLGQYIFGHGFSSVYLLGSFMQKFSPCLSQKSDWFTDFLFEFLVGPGHKLNSTVLYGIV